jgi:hypothetical protein
LLTEVQFRVVKASEGRVDFEMDINKDHTVSLLFYRIVVIPTSVHMG